MAFDPERHHRQSIRWQGHDYAAGGTYFVTICTVDRACLLGDVVGGQMRVNPCGLIVEQEWMRSGVMRSEVAIDVFAVMPNHLHGLVTIVAVGAHGGAPSSDVEEIGPDRTVFTSGRADRRPPLRRVPRSLGSLIAAFKQATTVRINALRNMPGAPVWQRGYYDHVVRDEEAFDQIAWYIATNSERWETDEENPDR